MQSQSNGHNSTSSTWGAPAPAPEPSPSTPLCASCDRCRSRKTKCDGARPCGNCATKYMKKNKVTSIEGIDLAAFECVYSPAKRRGPIPGRLSGRKTDESRNPPAPAINLDNVPQTLNNLPLRNNTYEDNLPELNIADHATAEDLYQQQLLEIGSFGVDQGIGLDGSHSHLSNTATATQQAYLQQLQQPKSFSTTNQLSAQRQRLEIKLESTPSAITTKIVVKHAPLLRHDNLQGNKLRSYYSLSIDDLFNFPPIPTDVEYGARLAVPVVKAHLLPRFDVAALQAARFSEIALGALVSHDVSLALELSNATVACLKNCVEEPVHPSCMIDVTRAYLLHALFRAYRGDFVRYFKYRRVAMSHLSQLDNVEGVETLFSALSIIDAWVYMVYNADDSELPKIDDIISPLPPLPEEKAKCEKYGICTMPSSISTSPDNQMWIQGPPPIFINNKAPPQSRSLDALACAMRNYCDQANQHFDGLTRQLSTKGNIDHLSVTAMAVATHQNELCSRNMVLSAFTLLQLHEASSNSVNKNHSHHLVISAMDAFLDGGDEEESGGFTESQIQCLMNVCNTIIEQPMLLYMAGPTYHMVTNVIILFCHLLNGLHANRVHEAGSDMEKALFDDVLDTFISLRKLLNAHRMKLPAKIRCHSIPRPKYHATPNDAFIDFSESTMCQCRGCQCFVWMACSPYVAAERAMAAKDNQEFMDGRDGQDEKNEFDRELANFGKQFDLDDDALLNVLSRIIAS